MELAQCVAGIGADNHYIAGFWCNSNVAGNTTADGRWYLYVYTTPTVAYTVNNTSASFYDSTATDYTQPAETQDVSGSNIHQLWFRDKNHIKCGFLECFSVNSSHSTTRLQSNRMSMRAFNGDAAAQIFVEVDSAGVYNTYAPRPADSSDSSNIATTAWCRDNVSMVPGTTFTDLSLQASGTIYTAPANGYVQLNKYTTTANRFIRIRSEVTGLSMESRHYTAGGFMSINLPVSKGEKFRVTYDADGATNAFKFIPSK